MPGRVVKDVLKLRGKPPDKGTKEWVELVAQIGEHKNQHFCAQAGGRRVDRWPCESTYVMKNGLCRMHNGGAARGVMHPRFKHGRKAEMFRHLPERFKKAYMASIMDDDLLSLRSDIALSDARVAELVERLDTGESRDRWAQASLEAAAGLVELNMEEPDLDEVEARFRAIENLVKRVTADERTWRDLKSSAQHRRKLVDSERQRLKELHAYLTAEEALALIARLTDTIIRHVEDKAVLSAILLEVQRLTGNDPADLNRQRQLEIVG